MLDLNILPRDFLCYRRFILLIFYILQYYDYHIKFILSFALSIYPFGVIINITAEAIHRVSIQRLFKKVLKKVLYTQI